MEYGLLGPLEARENGSPVPLGGRKQRAVLAVLLLNANHVVSRDRLIDDLWGEDPPETAVATVQVYVSRLRRLLPAGVLVTQAPGYVLRIDPPALDLARFERLVEEARKAELLAKPALLREALSLWRGPPLVEFASEPFARAEAGRLGELRLVALEELIDAELALGRHVELTPELEALVAEQPQRERFRTQLALALYRSGRHAEALEAVRAARGALDELGLEPTATLRELERQILTQDAALDLQVVRPLLALERPVPSPFVPEPRSPFVGRGDELRLFNELLERAESGSGGVILLGGEAGAGKTRLERELAHEAVARGALVLYGAADPVVRSPYQPLREWIEALVDVCDPDELRVLLRSAGGGALEPLVPRLAQFAEPVEEAREPGDRPNLHAAAVALLAAISRRVPLVLIADDVQWADGETQHALRELGRAAPGCRMLLLVGLRDRGEPRSSDLDESLAALLRLDWTTRVSLDRLTSADVHALVHALAGADPSDALMTAMVELTDGNALLVCELWRDLVTSRGVVVVDGLAELALPLADIRGPELIGDIVRQRIGRLDPATVAMLEQASVAAAHVELSAIGAATKVEQAALVTAVAEAVDTGMIEELPDPSPGFRFAHELVRRALYDRLPGIRRAELHGRFGEALESVHASDTTPVVADLAYHFTQAVPVLGPARAADYNVRAAKAAMDAIAFEEAIANLTTALELGIPEERRKSVRIELAYLLHEFGRIAEANALLSHDIESATGLAQRGAAARISLRAVGARMGDPNVDPAEMCAEAEDAVATFEALGDAHGLSHACRNLALALRRSGRLKEGCAAAERALASAEDSDDPAQRRRPIGTITYGLCDGPAPVPDALARCEELMAAAQGDRLFEALTMWAFSYLLAMAGRREEARERIARSLPVLDATHHLLAIRVYRVLVAEALELAGDLAGAEEQLLLKWQHFRDERVWVPDARAMQAAYQLGQLYCDQRRWDEAVQCLEYGREIAIPEYFRHESVLRLTVGARVEAHRGRAEEATALVRRAAAMADMSDFLNLRARTWLAVAEVEQRAGRTGEAHAAGARAGDLYRAKGNVAALARIEAGTPLTTEPPEGGI